jgi:hypothetical protein
VTWRKREEASVSGSETDCWVSVVHGDEVEIMSKTEHAAEKAREAMSEKLVADEYDRSSIDTSSAEFHRMQAEALENDANDLLVLDGDHQLGAGGEVIPTDSDESSNMLARNTLEAPDMINVEGSAKRIDLLTEAEVLASGLDAAQSICAKNSLEKMLAHQMALCHDAAFRTISEAGQQEDNIERVRLLNVGARFMKTFQEGFQTLHKIRNGNRQTMVVQHVNVSEGGQAVVAGEVGGSRGMTNNG